MAFHNAADALAGFFEECRLALFAIRRQFPILAAEGTQTAILDEMARLTHSMRGTAALLELPRLAELAGLQEEHWDALRTASAPCDAAALDRARQLTDLLERHLLDLEQSGHEPETHLQTALNLVALNLVTGVPLLACPAVPTADNDSQTLCTPDQATPPTAKALPPLLFPDSISPELRAVFLDEVEEHLRRLEQSRDHLLHAPTAHPDQLRLAHRAAHSLKGSAGAVGYLTVSRLAHQLEDLLEFLREQPAALSPDTLTLWQRSTDLLHDLTHRDDATDPLPLQTRLSALASDFDAIRLTLPADALATEPAASTQPGPDAAPEPAPLPAPQAIAPREAEAHSLRVPRADVDDLIRLNSEWLLSRSSLEQRLTSLATLTASLESTLGKLRHISGEIDGEYGTLLLRGRHSLDATQIDAAPVNVARTAAPESFDPLEFDRYTDFHVLTRGLAESTGDLSSLLSSIKGLSGELNSLLSQQTRLARQSQKRLVRLRMVTFGRIAGRLERAVRRIADDQHKQIAVTLVGQQVEFDKALLDQLVDPLLHLVRNAADHGVESPDVRRATGKSPCATLRIEAEYRATEVVVTIADDGRGFDDNRIRAVAIQRGLLTPEHAAALSSAELHQLVFAPGFSTASEVSEISGRGVGLDVVRSRVDELRGTLSLQTSPGQGTTWQLRFPLTLASTRALLVTAGHRPFAIPTHPVQQIRRIDPADLTLLAGRWLASIDGQRLPVVWLAERLGLASAPSRITAPQPLLLLSLRGETLALAVDRVESGREIVVKPLGNFLRKVPTLMGMTILGNGDLVPILDPHTLFSGPRSAPAGRTPAAPRRDSAAAPLIALADDSVSVRRVLVRLLQSHGYRTLEGVDGLDLIEKLAAHPESPALILLDIEMPRLDGYATLAALRDREEFHDLPVVMITSRAGEKHRRRALDLGATDYLVKPWQEDALLHLVQKLTQQTVAK